MKRLLRHLSGLVLLAMSVIMFAACATINNGTALNTVVQQTDIRAISLTIALRHSPKAQADLTWHATSKTLQVKLVATGLAPGSPHPVHIHVGSCAQNAGKMLYTLSPLKADAHGAAASTTTLQGVQNGIPASGWFINVHNGPTLATELEARAIACGDITNHQAAAQANQTVHLVLHATAAPDENVSGTASIQLARTTPTRMVVKLTVMGLVARSTHMAHIHVGSCAAQGNVVYPLQPVVADAHGVGTSTTTLSIKTIPSGGWYINIHEAGTMKMMQEPQGFNPLACGNIFP